MATSEFFYDAKCKHCRFIVKKKNPKRNIIQSYCNLHNKFIRANDLACDEIKLI